MRREILVQTGADFAHPSLDVAVERRHHRGHLLPAYSLIVAAIVRPAGGAGPRGAKLEIKRDARQKPIARYFLKVEKAAMQKVIATGAATHGVEIRVMARRAKREQEHFLDHL